MIKSSKDNFLKAVSEGSHKVILFQLNNDKFLPNYRSFNNFESTYLHLFLNLVCKPFEKNPLFQEEDQQIIHTATPIGKKWSKNCLEMHALGKWHFGHYLLATRQPRVHPFVTRIILHPSMTFLMKTASARIFSQFNVVNLYTNGNWH